MTHDLVYPMFAQMMLTLVVGLITVRTRFRAARSGQMDPRYFKTFSEGVPTEEVLKTGRHFSNLFEVPTLFFAACLAGMMVGVAGFLPLLLAWFFVGARVGHAWIHLGRNQLYPRMTVFFFGFACTVALWICVLIRTLQIGS